MQFINMSAFIVKKYLAFIKRQGIEIKMADISERKDTKKTKKISKDKRIAELEEENAMLRLQLQKFQQK